MAMSSMLIKTFQLSSLAAAVVLAGCGSGGGGNDTIAPAVNAGSQTITNPSTSTDTTIAARLTSVTTIQVVSDSSQFYMNNGETITLTVYALDKNNMGVANVPVSVTIPNPQTTGVFSATSKDLSTDETGKATVTLNVKSLTDAQKAELRKGLTISAQVGAKTATKTLTGSDAKPTTTTDNSVTTSDLVLMSNSSTLPMSLGSKIMVTAVALDSGNNVIANKPVTFKLVDSPANTGLFPNGSLAVTTNERGEATLELELKSLNAAQKAYLSSTGMTVTASADGKEFANKTVIKGIDANSSTTVNKVTLTTDTPDIKMALGSTVNVTASVLDKNNLGVASTPVNFTITDPALTGVFSASNASVSTNEKGEAVLSLQVKSLTDAQKQYLQSNGVTVSVVASTVSGGSVTLKGTTVETKSSVTKLQLVTSINDIKMEVGNTFTVTAVALNKDNGGVTGAPVNFAITDPELTGIFNTSGANLTTDAKGEAVITLQIKSLTDTQRQYVKNAGITISALSDNIVANPATLKGNDVIANKINVSAITLTNTNGQVSNTINSLGSNASVRVTDSTGKGIGGALVNFAADGVIFGTTNGSVLTNADGIATISIKPKNPDDTGSYQLSATATHETVTVNTSPINFTLQAVNTAISNMQAESTFLSSGGSTNISLVVLDATTNLPLNNVPVTFTTSCGTFTNASVTSSSQGNVTTSYKAIDVNSKLCEGSQTITATIANGTAQNIQVNIATIPASSIVYTTSNPVQLGAKGSGSSSSGQIEFTVYANGIPVTNQDVVITKNFAPEDFSFINLNNTAPQTVKSDANGKVTVQLYPGAKPGPVEIKATLVSDSNITALSKNVSVATGRATQNGVSLSLSKNVLENGVDGDTATVTARLVDRLGNAVPNGTVVSFIAEGGVITPNCATVDGVCTVTFTTQNPRPVDRRVSIIAYVEGDKSYLDKNGNNEYDAGDTLTDNFGNNTNIGNFFRDDNENNQYDDSLGEFIYRRGMIITNDICGASTFNQPNIAGTCDTNLPVTLRQQFVFGLADNTPTFVNPFSIFNYNSPANTEVDGYTYYNFRMYGNGDQTVSMPSGTTLAVTSIPSKTTYKPIVTISADTITVTGAKPNQPGIITVTADDNQELNYPVTIGSNGTGRVSAKVTGKGTFAPVNSDTCTAELYSGNGTVPANVNLLGGTGRVSDAEVSYTLRYKNCYTDDQIKITVSAPGPIANTTTVSVPVF